VQNLPNPPSIWKQVLYGGAQSIYHPTYSHRPVLAVSKKKTQNKIKMLQTKILYLPHWQDALFEEVIVACIG